MAIIIKKRTISKKKKNKAINSRPNSTILDIAQKLQHRKYKKNEKCGKCQRKIKIKFMKLTCVNFSFFILLFSPSNSSGDRGRYFSRSAGDTELRWKRKKNIYLLYVK